MTALGIAMGVSTLALTLWYRAPVLTAWSTPGAALLVTGLQGLTLAEAIGVFIVANALIVLCGVTGLFARLMQVIPHSLAAAMLAGILLRFGLQAFGHLDGELFLCGSMLLAWLALKVLAPRYAVIAAMVVGILVASMKGDIVTSCITFSPVLPAFIAPHFSLAHSLGVAIPLFLVTMASQKRARYRHDESLRLLPSGFAADRIYRAAGAGFISLWRLLHMHCRYYRRHLPESRSSPGRRASLAGCGCRRRVLSAGGIVRRFRYRSDGRPARKLDSDAGRAGAAGNNQR